MNANELADEWHKKNPMMDERELYAWGDEAATMLRQQQAEIEALKKENEELSHLCFEFGILRKVQEK